MAIRRWQNIAWTCIYNIWFMYDEYWVSWQFCWCLLAPCYIAFKEKWRKNVKEKYKVTFMFLRIFHLGMDGWVNWYLCTFLCIGHRGPKLEIEQLPFWNRVKRIHQPKKDYPIQWIVFIHLTLSDEEQEKHFFSWRPGKNKLSTTSPK